MLDFVRSAFRGFYVFFLWVLLIGCVIGGAIIGGTYGDIGGAIIGLIIGGLSGLTTVIIGGGLVAAFLNMDENLEIIARNISKAPQGNISDSGKSASTAFVGNKRQKRCKRCKREIDEDYSGCPHCGNNTFE